MDNDIERAARAQAETSSGVPEGWRFDLAEFARRMDRQLEAAHDMSGFEPIILHIAESVLTAAPTAPAVQGGEWYVCCEKLPKIGQRVILKKDGVIQNYMPTLDECDDEGLFWDFEDAADYDPLVDMEFDEWMPAPQPPKSKEGEGDE